jgi:hypothetical protein
MSGILYIMRSSSRLRPLVPLALVVAAVALADHVPDADASGYGYAANAGAVAWAIPPAAEHVAPADPEPLAPSVPGKRLSSFILRACGRALTLAKGDAKMLARLNVRLQRRFGFTCAS